MITKKKYKYFNVCVVNNSPLVSNEIVLDRELSYKESLIMFKKRRIAIERMIADGDNVDCQLYVVGVTESGDSIVNCESSLKSIKSAQYSYEEALEACDEILRLSSGTQISEDTSSRISKIETSESESIEKLLKEFSDKLNDVDGAKNYTEILEMNIDNMSFVGSTDRDGIYSKIKRNCDNEERYIVAKRARDQIDFEVNEFIGYITDKVHVSEISTKSIVNLVASSLNLLSRKAAYINSAIGVHEKDKDFATHLLEIYSQDGVIPGIPDGVDSLKYIIESLSSTCVDRRVLKRDAYNIVNLAKNVKSYNVNSFIDANKILSCGEFDPNAAHNLATYVFSCYEWGDASYIENLLSNFFDVVVNMNHGIYSCYVKNGSPKSAFLRKKLQGKPFDVTSLSNPVSKEELLLWLDEKNSKTSSKTNTSTVNCTKKESPATSSVKKTDSVANTNVVSKKKESVAPIEDIVKKVLSDNKINPSDYKITKEQSKGIDLICTNKILISNAIPKDVGSILSVSNCSVNGYMTFKRGLSSKYQHIFYCGEVKRCYLINRLKK